MPDQVLKATWAADLKIKTNIRYAYSKTDIR